MIHLLLELLFLSIYKSLSLLSCKDIPKFGNQRSPLAVTSVSNARHQAHSDLCLEP